jgi:NAD(P)-dependent dehydrogenase (short-subunit alcohol dehydrogenase family)
MKADEAIGSLRAAMPAAVFDFVVLELSSLASVRDAAKDILARFPAINILINNAGVMTTPFGRTADGFETRLPLLETQIRLIIIETYYSFAGESAVDAMIREFILQGFSIHLGASGQHVLLLRRS